MDKQGRYGITLPDPNEPGRFRVVGDPLTYEEALAYVQEYYGADAAGRVCLITRYRGQKELEPDDESGLRDPEKG